MPLIYLNAYAVHTTAFLLILQCNTSLFHGITLFVRVVWALDFEILRSSPVLTT